MRAVTIYPTPWRVIAVGLYLAGVLGLLWCVVVGVLLNEEGASPLLLARAVALLAAAPTAAGWLVRRAFRGTVELTATQLRLHAPGRDIDVPRAVIAGWEPGWIPVPDAGVAIRLTSGARLGVRLGLRDPQFLSDIVSEREPVARMQYLRAWVARPRHAWDRPGWKFGAFALLPTIPLFRVDQIISYGGWLGQYYQQGTAPYLLHLALYWLTVMIYLLMFATVVRLMLEVAAVAATAAAPARAAQTRQVVEWMCRALYYGAVPVLVLLRFTA